MDLSSCSLLFLPLDQINPLAETSDNMLVAADAKLNFDDNAAYRQKELFALRDPTQEDPREVSVVALHMQHVVVVGSALEFVVIGFLFWAGCCFKS